MKPLGLKNCATTFMGTDLTQKYDTPIGESQIGEGSSATNFYGRSYWQRRF